MSSTYLFLKGDNDGGYRLCGLTALPIERHFEWEMNGDKKTRSWITRIGRSWSHLMALARRFRVRDDLSENRHDGERDAQAKDASLRRSR